MLRDILNEAAALVSLMIFGATLLLWAALISELAR